MIIFVRVTVDAQNVGLALPHKLFSNDVWIYSNARFVAGQSTDILNTLQQFVYSIHH
jgi:hypothetical protein